MYNRNLPAGKYRARALQADAYPTKNGDGLMLGVEWVITEGEYEGCQITSRQCLVDNSGNVTKNYDSVREWAQGWDGVSTGWFKGNFSAWDVEIVVERRQSNKPNENGVFEDFPDVKWINVPGSSHGAAIEAGNHNALGAKFGAKLKAAAGNWNRMHKGQQGAANPPQSPAPAAPAPAAPAPEAPAQPAMTSAELKKETWRLFCERNLSLPPGDDRNQMFFKVVERITPEKNYDLIDAATWQKVIDLINNEMPF